MGKIYTKIRETRSATPKACRQRELHLCLNGFATKFVQNGQKFAPKFMQNSSKFAPKFVQEISILWLVMANRYLERRVDKELVFWKNDKEHKLLLLRGARQVGKSRSVRKLAELFEHFIEVNFEKNKKVHRLFDGDLDAHEICEKLSALFKKPIMPEKTLVFFDEIQSCPNAISALRFFYEDYPELHVIAAGSLLEFALEELPSFGVGRIRSVFMYPLSFACFIFSA
jgi:predicted AAA+ superfamily ATPase